MGESAGIRCGGGGQSCLGSRCGGRVPSHFRAPLENAQRRRGIAGPAPRLDRQFRGPSQDRWIAAASPNGLADAARPSAVWASFPENALFAAAGRVPWEPAAEAGSEFLTADALHNIQDSLERTIGAILGRDVLPHLLRHFGPDWGVCLTPPETGDKGWLPSLTAVLRLRPGGDGGPPVEQRVLDGLDFAARLGVLGYNSRRAGHSACAWSRKTVLRCG